MTRAGACALALLLAGCSADPSPSPEAPRALPFHPRAHGLLEVERRAGQDREQRWLVTRPDGEIRVRVDTPGLVPLGASSAGLSFDGPDGRVYGYGHGTFIDAEGARTPISARLVPGGLELVVPASIVAASALPAWLDPIVSAETDPAPRRIVDADREEPWEPAMACAGAVCLVAWIHDGSWPQASRFVRIDAEDGRLLDAGANTQPSYGIYGSVAEPPRVATDGTDFLVAGTRSAGRGAIAFRVRASDGAILDTPELALGEGWASIVSGLAFGGGRYWIHYTTQDAAGIRSAYRQSVLPDGTVGLPTSGLESGLACAGDVCATPRWGGLERFDAVTGAPLTPVPVDGNVSSLLTEGDDFVVSGGDTVTRVEASTGLVRARVTLPPRSMVAAASDGIYYVLRDWTLHRHRADGTELTPAVAIDPRAGVLVDTPLVTAHAGVVHLVWRGRWALAAPFAAIMGRAFPADAPSVELPRLLTRGAASRDRPALSAAPDHALVAFVEREGDGFEVLAGRVDWRGRALDPEPLRSPSPAWGYPIFAAYGAGKHLVVWAEHEDFTLRWRGRYVHAARFEWLGESFAIPISVSSVTFDGSRFAICGPDGSVLLDAVDGAATSSPESCGPARAADADGFVEATVRSSSGPPPHDRWIELEALDRSGAPLTLVTIPAMGDHVPVPVAVAIEGAHIGLTYVIDRDEVWFEQRRRGDLTLEHRARLGDTYRSWWGDNLALAFREDRWLVVWSRHVDEARLALDARTVSLDGALGPLELVTDGSTEAVFRPRQLSLACRGRECLLAYERFVWGAGVHANQVRARALAWSARGDACSGDAACASGHCADGVCCASACGPCGACSVAEGSSADGTCTPRPAGALCRGAIDACDAIEVCDGASLACPADVHPACELDAGSADAAIADGGLDAAASEPDAGLDAASDLDAGPDGASDLDAGLDGASARRDASESAGAPPELAGGCGCRASRPSAPPAAWLTVLLALAGASASRRRRCAAVSKQRRGEGNHQTSPEGPDAPPRSA